MKRLLLFSMCVWLAASASFAKKVDRSGDSRIPTATWSDMVSRDRPEPEAAAPALHTAAAANTLVLASYVFESGATCTAQGWTAVDVGRGGYQGQFSDYSQIGTYWHVDDFAPTNSLGSIVGSWMTIPGQSYGGITFSPIQGARSMWCGKRIPPAGPVDTIHCRYQILPGYGTQWNQSFGTKNCLSVAGGATPELDMAFTIKFDCEPGYDATLLEYTLDCSGDTGWIEIDGGINLWDGADSMTVSASYPVSGSGPVNVRFRFASDSAFSNQDGLYPGFGVAIDDLAIEELPVEDFEGEAIGSNESDDWRSYPYGFGNYLALFRKTTGANYEDECHSNISCYWAAIQGSPEFYTCGTPPQPAQRVVPHKNVRNEYLANEIWSPVIPLSGSGTEFRLRYSVYRDLPYDNLVFHQWHVRTIPASGCPTPWADRDMLFYGDTKDWALADHSIGTLMNLSTAVSMQVAIGVLDMCEMWCGVQGSGACHSPAPYIDNVEVLRVDIIGPQWDVRVIDTFQDTFAADGTVTGTARADAALDIKPSSNPSITPGDSAVVFYLVDPKYIAGSLTGSSGLLADPTLSTYPLGRATHTTKRQAYLWVQVWPYDGVDNPGDKVGEDLAATWIDGGVDPAPGGTANRWPFAGTQTINGTLWTKIRMDYTYRGTATNPGTGINDSMEARRFCVDLNDALFTPGDTILYFFGAASTDGTTYYSTEYGPTTSISEIAANPMELTILPAGGFNRGGNILYVDGTDGLGNEPYFHGAFMLLGIDELVDRYDVRAPDSGGRNRLASRVTNIQNQLNNCYGAILWDTGSLSMTLGDGSIASGKANDYGLLNTFLDNLTTTGGLYICGDDVAEQLNGYAGSSAVTFRSTYMPFSLITGNHRASPTLFNVSPSVIHWPGRAFNDDYAAFGGCPALNDFDVIGATGSSLVQMSYSAASSPNGAVVSNVNGDARVVISGFSFAAIRDDELDGHSDRAEYLAQLLVFVGPGDPISTPVGPAAHNGLSQNYPNPFNPSTTIAFSINARGHVALNVYDVAGRLVRTLSSEVRAAGPHTVTWDGHDTNGDPVASGVYFYRLHAGSFTQTRKMVLLK